MKKNICRFVVGTLLALISTNAYSVTFKSADSLALYFINETNYRVKADICAFAAALNKEYENYSGLVEIIEPQQIFKYEIAPPNPQSNTAKYIWFHSWAGSDEHAWETGNTDSNSILINGEKLPLRLASSYDWLTGRAYQYINIVEAGWVVLEDTSGHTLAFRALEEPKRTLYVRIDGGGRERRTNYVCIHILPYLLRSIP
jgi:hypothetical protein